MPWEKQFDVEGGLVKAMDLFWDRGYEATSMQDLVDAMGVNRASLYATYGDKRALFLSALRAYDSRRRRQALEELERRYTPRQAIQELFNVFACSISDDRPGRGCFLTNTALELAAHDDEVREVVAGSQKGVEGFLLRMIKKGKQAGEIGKGVQPARTAKLLLSTLIGVVVLTRSRPEPALLRSIVGDAMHLLD